MALTPAQRIAIQKRIAAYLGERQCEDIDLVLREFRLQTTHDWEGGLYEYVLAMLAHASEDELVELGNYVDEEQSRNSRSLTQLTKALIPTFWLDGQLRVFISHLASEREYVGQLKVALADLGICAFVAHDDIEPTKDWRKQIEDALFSCQALVALLHKGFHASKWTDQEIGFAMGCRVPTFSVRFGETPYGFIDKFQAFNGNGKDAKVVARELRDAYLANHLTRDTVAEAAVRLFENCHSFQDAKSNMTLLEGLPVWRPDFSSRLQAALEANSQVADAHTVPERIKKLINRWENSATVSRAAA